MSRLQKVQRSTRITNMTYFIWVILPAVEILKNHRKFSYEGLSFVDADFRRLNEECRV